MTNTQARVKKLLKPSEVTACKQLAGSELNNNKRAAALLSIHQGKTHAQAAETSGLSLGQIKYIVTRFRKLGMNALDAVRERPENSVDTAVEVPLTKSKKAKADKKDKKAKKDKPKNKDKKTKKDKKDKKKNKKKNKNK
jgi:hypothetical protein